MFRLCRILRSTAPPTDRHLISIGGWCGPALMLGKLSLRHQAYPFDFSRCTLDGVIHFIENGFDEGFYPPGPTPYQAECVGMWMLFRGRHTAFAHFDLNDAEVLRAFERKMRRWDARLNGDEPVTFFRTVAARDPLEELRLLPKLEAALSKRNPSLDFRIVTTVHDQGLVGHTSAAVPFAPISDRISLWGLEYKEDATHSLFDRAQKGYEQIVRTSLHDAHWKDLHALNDQAGTITRDDGSLVRSVDRTVEAFSWRSHNNIALIDGVASVGGTCRGIGSTEYVSHGEGGIARCSSCGSVNFHKAGKPYRSDRPFTQEEDELLLVHLYKILMGGDKVAAVEQLASETNRGAFEIICRIQFLTNSSTKITEGMSDEDL